MSSTTTQTAPPVARLILRPEAPFASDLHTKGYAVVKACISKEKAAGYVQRAYDWLEGFKLGFDRNDRSTWHAANLPPNFKGGLYNQLGVGQTQHAWDVRSEQGYIDAFAQIWGTDELVCSFDASNYSIPLPTSEITSERIPWPHVDQSPLKLHFACVQGIANMLPNGPNDGGLMVLEGSLPLYNEFFESHENEKPITGWPTIDSYKHTPSQMQWFMNRGCTWKHVDAEPGDLILWDSRTIHYGAAPSSDTPRIAQYICYKPASQMTPEAARARADAFESGLSTTHDPLDVRIVPAHATFALNTPYQKPILSERGQKLAGFIPY